jgi:hypothetical protein
MNALNALKNFALEQKEIITPTTNQIIVTTSLNFKRLK